MKRTAFYALLFLSGVAGLGYEMLWTQMLVAGLGHEMVSVLGVVNAFFSGLALGAWVLDGPVSRSAAPGKWYALLETIVGLWALVLVAVLPDLNHLVSGMIRDVLPSMIAPYAVHPAHPTGRLSVPTSAAPPRLRRPAHEKYMLFQSEIA